MGADNNRNRTEVKETSIQKKVSLPRGVWYDIGVANEKNGFKDLRHMLTEYGRVGNLETIVDQRRNMKFRTDCAHLQTIANKINAGIDKEENINAFVKGMNRICAELK